MAPGEPVIAFRDVHKAFGPKRIYTGLNLDVFEGETLVILGGSGVGKSVMLKMLIGLLTADKGSITYRGQEVVGMKEAELQQVRRQVAMIFQASALFDSITVGDNVAYALHEHFFRTMKREEIDKRVAWALELVGLPGIEAMRPADLSGGMKRRVSVARAIALQPSVLLYDEPTTGLDPINTTRINHLIRGMQKALKVTSIVVTHDMASAFSIGDRLAMVHRGQIILQGTREDFRNSPDERVQDFIQGAAPEGESLESLLEG
ncbi:MAG: ABC transporter ATP-binding protein [Myxococcales bacterium]|nr:MAG: ABC transporter ATP-binding protein [Myxococcales bacterium]